MRDRNGNIQFFMSGRQGSLGAEGFILGSLYIAASGSLALVTQAVPRTRNKHVREGASWILACTALMSLYYTFKVRGVPGCACARAR